MKITLLVIGGIALAGLIIGLWVMNIRLRKRLRALEPQPEQPVRLAPSHVAPWTPADSSQPKDPFMVKLMEIMDRRLGNSQLTVSDIVSEMGMGRTVFFTKLKSHTGMSPVAFVRELRLWHAARLLKEPNYNISEVAYKVGMNDSRYFAKCFKHTYGMTPTEYRQAQWKELDK